MPLPFNKTLDLTLLKLVKENPIIYNSKHPKYLDFDTREVVWQKIGDILNRPAQVAKQRWINIRDMMRRKIRDRLRNPNHRSYNYKYEEEMSFMLPYFKETTSNANDEYSDFFDESPCEVELPEVFTEQSEFSRADPRDVKPNLTYKKRLEDSTFNDSRNEFGQDLNPADPIDVFLITIGSTLRKFSPYYLNQAKSKIFQVVQDYELQQIVDKEQPSVSDTNR
ncbi:uncharacterized protein LOC120634673 [Pararge aegeria]|uniref:Jg16859 protein n=1 Tax=Pararge aegeria aegeria TaxID=348720 RepID=A0A8S4SNJ0_9NEOP|nr:uncharacterized protein LOC120634673 [Pararge aegeria]CAH2268427.1 jg16859 [Pararge aegeria aegeria]